MTKSLWKNTFCLFYQKMRVECMRVRVCVYICCNSPLASNLAILWALEQCT